MSGDRDPRCGSEFGVVPRSMPLAYNFVEEKTVCHPTGLSMTCIAALIMMQPDVGDELGRGGVGMGWAEVVLWVRGVDTARFLFFKTLFP